MKIANQCNNAIFVRYLLKDPRLNDESKESSPIVDHYQDDASFLLAQFRALDKRHFFKK